MHFTYRSDLGGDLQQGDILKRTPELEELLRDIHPHYFQNKNNQYFIILTQSCDLVRRDGISCKARYISFAAVRPVTALVENQIERNAVSGLIPDIPVCTLQSRNKLGQFLQRLLNNNEPGYFYLHHEPTHGLPDDYCAFLRLSVAIKSDLHYEKCIEARQLGLDQTFQSKLGWLVGQMFSRVGTKDWAPKELTKIVREHLGDAAIWVDDRSLKQLTPHLEKWRLDHPEQELDQEQLIDMIDSMPNRKELVLNRVHELIKSSKLFERLLGDEIIDENDLERLIKKLRSDQILTNRLT